MNHLPPAWLSTIRLLNVNWYVFGMEGEGEGTKGEEVCVCEVWGMGGGSIDFLPLFMLHTLPSFYPLFSSQMFYSQIAFYINYFALSFSSRCLLLPCVLPKMPWNLKFGQIHLVEVSLSQSDTKNSKFNGPWPKSNQFWRWLAYNSIPHVRSSSLGFPRKYMETSNLTIFDTSRGFQNEENQQNMTKIW